MSELSDHPVTARRLPRCGGARLWLLMLCVTWLLVSPAHAIGDKSPHVVFVIGEEEYKTSETLPEFAKTELEPRGMRVTVIQADEKERNHFPGLIQALSDADLVVLSVRRRLPPKEQLDAVRAYLDAGKPLVGIRTACHAFAPPLGKNKPTIEAGAGDSWPDFDPQVLGGHYVNHYGPSAKVAVTLAPGAESSAVLKDIDVAHLVGNGTLYRVSPIDPSCVPLLIGTIPDKPAEPLAWTHLFGPKNARIFYTSLGHPDDFKEPAFRKLLLNGMCWAMDRKPPTLGGGANPGAESRESAAPPK